MPIISEVKSHQRCPRTVRKSNRRCSEGKPGTPPQHEKCQSLAQTEWVQDRGDSAIPRSTTVLEAPVSDEHLDLDA